MHSYPGFFITIEGIEGVGKSTALKFLQNLLMENKKDVVITREPGGTPIAENIRQILLSPNKTEMMTQEAELLLMFACRAQHVATVIQPALQAGKWVVSDRFTDASYAYQGGGRGMDLKKIETLEKWVVADINPNLTILLDAPPAIGMMRAKNRGPHDRIEQEKFDFFERVRAEYLARAAHDKNRFRIIDATQSIDAVQKELTEICQQILRTTNKKH